MFGFKSSEIRRSVRIGPPAAGKRKLPTTGRNDNVHSTPASSTDSSLRHLDIRPGSGSSIRSIDGEHMESTDQKRQSASPAPVADADRLGSNSLNLPNAITSSRLILALVLFGLIDYDGYWKTGTIVFVVAVATDALDGFIARRYGMVTVLGRILDPFVDKFIICGTFIFLLAKQADSGINAWMVMVVIGREMFVTSLRGFLEREGKDFSAAWSGKIKMALQCVALTFSLFSLAPEITESPYRAQFCLVRDLLLWLAVASTIWSGLVYIVRAVKLLRSE